MRRQEANPPGQRGGCGIEACSEEQDAVVVDFLGCKGCAASRRNVIASRQQHVEYVVPGVTALRLVCSHLDVGRDQGVDGSQVLQLGGTAGVRQPPGRDERSEEHTSELQSLMRTSYAVFCLKKKNVNKHNLYIRIIKIHKNKV